MEYGGRFSKVDGEVWHGFYIPGHVGMYKLWADDYYEDVVQFIKETDFSWYELDFDWSPGDEIIAGDKYDAIKTMLAAVLVGNFDCEIVEDNNTWKVWLYEQK